MKNQPFKILKLLAVFFSTCLSPLSAGNFNLSSTDIAEGKMLTQKQVFNGFGHSGENKSPQLSWENAPEGTKSFVITMYDPDAPTGSGWWHWVAFNIPASATQISANASATEKMPPGTLQSRNDFGTYQFGGAAPPKGKMHRYQVTIHALNVEKIELAKDASPALVGFMTRAHSIGSAQITAVFAH